MEEKVFIKTNDGVELCGIWEMPSDKTNKVIVLAHGLTVTKDEDGKFSELSQLLTLNGFAVFRFDFRGHGESEGKQEEMTIAEELIDLGTALTVVREKGFTDVGLVGASFGGGVSILYVATHSDAVDCLCLWNPCINYDHTFINPYLPWLKDKKESMQKDFQAKGYSEVGSRKYRLGKSVFEEMKNLFPFEEMKKIKVPTMIIHGDKDTYVPYEDSKEYFESLSDPKEFVTVPNGEHGLNNTPEEKKLTDSKTLEFFKKYL